MTSMTITFEDGAAKPFVEKGYETIHLGEGSPPIIVAVLDKGMTSGRPSVALLIDAGEKRLVVAEVSARLFCSAARAIIGRYPDLMEDGGGT